MKKASFYLSILLVLLVFTSCTKSLIGPERRNTPTENFSVLWNDFDEHYGAFVAKGIDWKAVSDSLRPQVNDKMSATEFYALCKKMLDVLDDNHVYLRPTAETGLPWYAGGVVGRTRIEDYRKEVANQYLNKHTVYNNAFEYGNLPGHVGYIRILNFSNNISTYDKAMDDILAQFKESEGIVIDMRQNSGGEDRVAQYIANRFASDKSLSFSVRLRNGPRHTDFSAPIDFYTEPAGSYQYTKPVVVLTNLSTFSSGETFVLAMLQNKQVKIVGDVTGGALSDAVPRELPNGWLYRLPIADVRDARGTNLEGHGIQPHIKVKNTKTELAAGQDKALEKALAILQ